MSRYLFISFFFFLLLDARENPFFPAQGEKDILITSNINRDKEPLKRAAITLPSQARELKKVTIEYKNLDGSVEKKSIELDNRIDWHLPIFISQNYGGSSKEVKMEASSSIKPRKSSVNEEYKVILSMKYLTFLSLGKKLKLMTKDEIVRDFVLVNPQRIVIDFKKDIDIKSYIKEIPKNMKQKK